MVSLVINQTPRRTPTATVMHVAKESRLTRSITSTTCMGEHSYCAATNVCSISLMSANENI